jgi:hypothetical protein
MADRGSQQAHSRRALSREEAAHPIGERRLPAEDGAWFLRNGNRAHELTREERARGGYMKAANRRFRAELLDAADRIVGTLCRVGEEDAAQVVQELFLPHTIERPWELTRKSPLAKANERIAELEDQLDAVLDDVKLSIAMEKLAPKLDSDDPKVLLAAVDAVLDLMLGPASLNLRQEFGGRLGAT